MHILFYISRFGIGGIQTFVIQMAKELIKKEGVKVSIFCHYPELIDNSQNEAIPSEIEIFALSKNQGKIVWINRIRNILKIFGGFDFKEWFTRRYFLKLVKTKGVNIIHNNIQTGDYNVFLAQQKKLVTACNQPTTAPLCKSFRILVCFHVGRCDRNLRSIYSNCRAATISYLTRCCRIRWSLPCSSRNEDNAFSKFLSIGSRN